MIDWAPNLYRVGAELKKFGDVLTDDEKREARSQIEPW